MEIKLRKKKRKYRQNAATFRQVKTSLLKRNSFYEHLLLFSWYLPSKIMTMNTYNFKIIIKTNAKQKLGFKKITL